MKKNENNNNNEFEHLNQDYLYSSNITIRGIDIAFLDLVKFLVKLAIASIPGGIIFIIFYGILTGFLGLLGLGALFNAIF
tara:strand:- start:28 stop:267 length:240 start_codon:yes stop_codon:yes gene_type:complete